MNLFLSNFNFNTSENIILPKCSTLVVLRNTHQEEDESDHKDWTNIVKNGPTKLDCYSEKRSSKLDYYSEKWTSRKKLS
jgi:dipeptidase